MAIKPLRYPLDLTGVSRDNLVLNELRELTPSKVRVVVPSGGPFYTKSFVLRDTATGRVVPVGESYYFGNFHKTASTHAKAEIASMVIITDTRVSRNVSFDYQVIGGQYGYNHAAIIDQIELLQLDNRPVDWNLITNKPIHYEPAKHLHDIGDIYGFEYLTNALEEIRQALLLGDEASHTAIYNYIDRRMRSVMAALEEAKQAAQDHADRTDNPHQVTAGQTGAFTKAETNQLVNDLKAIVNNHISARGNVHGLTPDQLGVYTKRAIDDRLRALEGDLANRVNTHIADTNNPHRTTAAQVGAYTKTETNNLVNPLNTRLSSHETNYNNPHKVTAAQVGAYTKAETNKLVEAVKTALGAHANARGNVHGLTPAQLGVYSKQEMDTRLGTLEGDLTNRVNAHINNVSNPHRVTAAQTGAYTKAEVNNLINGVNGKISTHETNYNNPHRVTAAQTGAYTKAEVDSRIKTVNDKLTQTTAKADKAANDLTALTRRVARLEGVDHTNLIKQYVEQHILDPKTRKLRKEVVPISSTRYNAITWNNDGLYYGTEPSAATANLYVDPVSGVDVVPTVDNKAGTREKPLRTIKFAIMQGEQGTNRNIWLYEGREHVFNVAEEGRVIMNGGGVVFRPYGPQRDKIQPTKDDNDLNLSPRVRALNTRILLKGTLADKNGAVYYFHQYHFAGQGFKVTFRCVTVRRDSMPIKYGRGVNPTDEINWGNGQGIVEPWGGCEIEFGRCEIYTGTRFVNPEKPGDTPIDTALIHSSTNSSGTKITLYGQEWDYIHIGNTKTDDLVNGCSFLCLRNEENSQLLFFTRGSGYLPTYDEFAPKVNWYNKKYDPVTGSILGLSTPVKKDIVNSSFTFRGGKVYGKVDVGGGVMKEFQVYPAVYADTIEPLA